MTRLHLICEGQTEEDFARFLLVPHFESFGIDLRPSCIGKVDQKGGRVNLQRLEFDVKNRFVDKACYCTTLFDFYGLPRDFPGKAESAAFPSIADKQGAVIQALTDWAKGRLRAEDAVRFLPYVQMHEFEALLFSEPGRLAQAIEAPKLKDDFERIRESFQTPEWINDDPMTAPSKRIKNLHPRYSKPTDPVLAAEKIGLAAIRRECPLFSQWLSQLESLGR